MAETSDVVIVGGGAAGSAVAYYLSLAGVKATIVEKEGVASQASGFSAGGLNPLQGAEIPGRLGALAWASYLLHLALWEELPEETGIGYDGRVMSAIRLAFEESELPELQETLDVFGAAAGFEARWLDPSELSALEPRVTTKAVRALLTGATQPLIAKGTPKPSSKRRRNGAHRSARERFRGLRPPARASPV